MAETAAKLADNSATDAYRLDAQIGFILRKASQRHLAIFGEIIPDLTARQFAALAKLHELGPLSQNGLGRETAMDAATIKGVVDRLSQRGLVTTRPSEIDRRRMVVELAPEGAALFDEPAGSALRVSDRTLEPLSSAERLCLLSLLSRLT